MRIGFVCGTDPYDQTRLGGLVYAARKQVDRFGGEVVDLWRPGVEHREPLKPGPRAVARAARARVRRLRPQPPKTAGDVRRERLEAARAWSRDLQRRLEGLDIDVIINCVVTTPLIDLETDVPIVHLSDTVVRDICNKYPLHRFQSEGSKDAFETLEQAGLKKITFGLWTSSFVARSAVEDYGADPAKQRVVALGANVKPLEGVNVQPREAPPRDRLNMCVVASDPVRKRLETASLATELLNERGWKAQLTYIGPRHKPVDDVPCVRWAGNMLLDREVDRAMYREVLSSSDLMLLPSMAENYGIAPAEAAHFGAPSVISDSLGYAEFMGDPPCGVAVPNNSFASNYADAVEALVSDPERYRRMSAAALERAHTVFEWDIWGDALHALAKEACAERAGAVAV